MRRVRPLPAPLPHLPPDGPRDRLAAGAHRGDARRGGGPRRRGRLLHDDDGRVPGVPGLRGRLPQRRALRAHDRGGARPGRADAGRPGAGGQASRPRRGPPAAAAGPGGRLAAGRGAGAAARPARPAHPARLHARRRPCARCCVPPPRRWARARRRRSWPGASWTSPTGRRSARRCAPWRRRATGPCAAPRAGAAGPWRCTTASPRPRGAWPASASRSSRAARSSWSTRPAAARTCAPTGSCSPTTRSGPSGPSAWPPGCAT